MGISFRSFFAMIRSLSDEGAILHHHHNCRLPDVTFHHPGGIPESHPYQYHDKTDFILSVSSYRQMATYDMLPERHD